MIVPMRSVTVLCLLADQERALKALQRLGVLHPAPVVTPDSEALEAVRGRLAAAREALEALAGEGTPSGVASAAEEAGDADAVVEKVHEGLRRERELKAALESLERERAAVSPLGHFEPADVRRLEAGGLCVRFLQVAGEIPGNLPAGTVVRVLGGDKAARVVAVIGREPVDIPGIELALPARSLREVEAELARTRQDLERNTELMNRLRGSAGPIRRRLAQLEEEESFLLARDGMGQWQRITYLQGYCPGECVVALREAAAREGWGLLVREPAADEAVPTLLRNPAWVRPIQAVFDMIGILPGYREIDVSSVFLVFFSVFFAMLVGDAGYGAIFLVLTRLARRRFPKAPAPPFALMTLMSVCTVAWGVLTGTYFGIAEVPAVLLRAKVDWLSSEDNLKLLCFGIGTVHLMIAHAWNGWYNRRTLQGLAQVGWMGTTLGMFYLSRFMVLGTAMPGWVVPVMGAGTVLIVLFMTPVRALKDEWFNHVMLPLNLVSNFMDVISYVRLYAVGMASLALAMAFNEMAAGFGPGAGARIGAAVVLLLGHSLNLVLSVMGVLVHGVRLNALEFSSHIGVSWTGFPYAPLARNGKNG